MRAWKTRLRENGIPVKGPIDHGICSSIYFSDPNGYVLEFAAENETERAVLAQEAAEARANLAKWMEGGAVKGRHRHGTNSIEAAIASKGRTT